MESGMRADFFYYKIRYPDYNRKGQENVIKVDTNMLWIAYEKLGIQQDKMEQILEEFHKKWFYFCEEAKGKMDYEGEVEKRKKDMKAQINGLTILRMSLEKAIYVYEETEENLITKMENRRIENAILELEEQSTEGVKQQLQKLQIKV